MMVMMLRRSKLIGGELGGPRGYKLATSFLFVALWLFYVLMSSLEAYGYIQGTYKYLSYYSMNLMFVSPPPPILLLTLIP